MLIYLRYKSKGTLEHDAKLKPLMPIIENGKSEMDWEILIYQDSRSVWV